MANPQSITIGANTYSLVPMPASPGPRSITPVMNDTVADSPSPFTKQNKTLTWPGADWWEFQVTMPPMAQADAANWIAWLAQLRGRQCVFLLGDGSAPRPQGQPQGVPLVDGTVGANNGPTTTVLYTRGWTAGRHRLLLPRDYLQIGYRLYMCLDLVNADADGNAAINIWPSIREQPADGTAITLRNPSGLFRLSDNARSWNYDVARLYGLSFSAEEVR